MFCRLLSSDLIINSVALHENKKSGIRGMIKECFMGIKFLLLTISQDSDSLLSLQQIVVYGTR